MNISYKPKVGVLDSGIGGISTLIAMRTLMPTIEFDYYMDAEHCPYGDKRREFVLSRVDYIIGTLVDRGCNIIVLACNTATNIGVSSLRGKYGNIPIVGIEPAIKTAFEHGNSKTLLLATPLTIMQERLIGLVGRFYDKRISDSVFVSSVTNQQIILSPQAQLASAVQNSSKATYIHESGLYASINDCQIYDKYVQDMVWEIVDSYIDVDSVVLGCTHYCFCRDIIATYYASKGRNVDIVDGNIGVAKRVRNIIQQYNTKQDNTI